MKTYREVLCPDCQKKYMTYVYSDEYDVVIELESGILYGWSDCPKCSNNLNVVPKEIENVKLINVYISENVYDHLMDLSRK